MKNHVAPLVAAVAALLAAAACGGTNTIVTTSDAGGPATDASGVCDPATSTCDDAGADGATDPTFNTPSVCTSKTHWTRGDRGSQSMHPGVACIACHDTNNGPSFSIAGTVFPTAHEPDDCNGVSGASAGAEIVITDATGAVTTIPVNSVGNFYWQTDIAMPFHAKVVVGGKERAMVAAQKSGDCNSCHTETGASSAPGRIVAP